VNGKAVLPAVAVLGGTGHLGGALARRWAQAGYPVILGSRDASRAADAAAVLAGECNASVRGLANRAAADAAEIVVVTVPWVTQQAVLEDIRPAVAGKLVVDTTVPLVPPRVMRVQLPPEGSAAARAQQILGPGVTVVSAFHNVAAHKLAKSADVDCDVLVFGDQKEARERVIALAAAAGLRAIHGGALVNSAAAEALTSILIFINKTYAVDGAGLRITGELSAGA
jgi:NADPH-dependent F420 reductase